MSDATERFSNRVADYVRYRPHYPQGVVDLLVRHIGLTPDWTVADVGSGTGLSAKPFLRHGCHVKAIEPNDAMRKAAVDALAEYPAFESVDGRAEHTTLASASVDLVVAAQAFHWFDLTAARAEFVRILKVPPHVALMWNRRRTGGTRFLEEYEAFLLRHGTDYQRVRHENVSDNLLGSFFNGPFERHVLESCQRLDHEGLAGRVRSSSYMPAPGHPRYPSMIADLASIYERFATDGAVVLTYDLEIYLGRV